jgi:hypothetical protein
VGCIPDPGRPVDGRPGVVALVPSYHIAGVDPDAQPQGPAGQRLLDGQGAGDSVSGTGKCGHEAVALALLHRTHSVMATHLLVHHGVQGSEVIGHGLRVGLPSPGRPLHVAQDECDRPCR